MTESELLFTELLNCSRERLYLNRKYALSREEGSFLASALKRRVLGEPIQYILGGTEFMGLRFKLTADVFIPRPETEILVETTIKIGHRLKVIGERLKILDLGTGSGNIAISLAKFLTDCEIIGIDISGRALKIAENNARLNNVDNVKFIQGNLFSPFTFHLSPFTLIVSNPPYIPTAEIERLEPELSFEPHNALDGGSDGLDFYRRIIQESPAHLKGKGFLIMEMGFNQAEAIKKIFRDSGNFKILEVVKDYNDIDRVIVAQIG